MTKLLNPVSPSEASAAQAYIAKAEMACWTLPDVPPDTPLLAIERVGVVGAGTMGGGIAMNFLNVGIPVTIVETSAEALDRGLATIRRNYDRSVQRGRLTQDELKARMALLKPSLDLQDLATVDLVVEAVFEDMEIKKALFRRLDGLAKPGAILASNTSYLDINEMAGETGRPESVIGLHFFSPANVMKLLEVVRGAKTSPQAIASSMALAKRIGKTAVLVGVCMGFVGNRILFPRQEQAYRLLAEGVMPWDVDAPLTAFGFPMGPFAMADLAGLDIGWSKADADPKNLRDVLCHMDRRGQKVGAGFYDYDAERRATPSPIVEQAILDISGRTAGDQVVLEAEDVLERCLFPMVNEAARILEEGVAARASDIDVIWLRGFGWPAARGGLMYWAEQVGLPHIVSRLEDFAATYGEGLAPTGLLRAAADRGGFDATVEIRA